MNSPYFYDVYNLYNASISPSTVHTQNTALTNYYVRYLIQRAISVFKWNFPKIWERRAKNYFLYTLYCIGFISVIETDKFGIIPQNCTLTGYDVFYQPTRCVISNQLINRTIEPEIGKQCSLIKLQSDYFGILDIIYYYADQLALLAEAVSVNAVNSKLSFAFGSENKAGAETLKKMYDHYTRGEPAVFYDKDLIDPETGQLNVQFFNNDVRTSYIISDLLNDIRTIMNDFDSMIGISNANTQKRERMLVDEINANNQETKTLCELWLENLQTGCQETKDLFGIEISVDWRKETEVIKNDVVDNSTVQL